MEISFVVPIFNEEENILLLVEKLELAVKGKYSEYEFILVDDGSTDKSKEILEKLSKDKKYLKPIFFKKNCGQSAALSAGFKYCSGDIVVSMDGDLQTNPKDISLLIPYLKEYDMVNGMRATRQDGFYRKLASLVGNSFRNFITKDNIHDTGCPLKVFKREVVKSFYLYKGMHRFLPTLAKINGFSVIEIAVPHYDRIYGKSKYTTFNRLFVGFEDVFAVRWMKKRRIDYEIADKKNY